MKKVEHNSTTKEPWAFTSLPELCNSKVEIEFATRGFSYHDETPNPLYSSIKYNLKVFIGGEITTKYDLLHCQIGVKQQIASSEAINRYEISSIILTAHPNQICEGTLPLSIHSSISSHYSKHTTQLELSIFDARNIDCGPLAILTSPSLLFYARKPNNSRKLTEKPKAKQVVSKKRKLDVIEEPISTQPEKNNAQSNFNRLKKLVDTLIDETYCSDDATRICTLAYIQNQIQFRDSVSQSQIFNSSENRTLSYPLIDLNDPPVEEIDEWENSNNYFETLLLQELKN